MVKNIEYNRSSTLKYNGEMCNILGVYYDNVKYIDKNEMLNFICGNNKVLRCKIESNIPNVYLKEFNIEGEIITFVDRMVLTIVHDITNDYDLYTYIVSITAPLKKYKYEIFLDIFPSMLGCNNNFKILEDDVCNVNRLQQDFLHKLEKEDLNDEEMIKLSRKMKDLRMKRRELKNRLTYIKLFKMLFDKCEIKSNELKDMKDEFYRIKYCLDNKIYKRKAEDDVISKYNCKELFN